MQRYNIVVINERVYMNLRDKLQLLGRAGKIQKFSIFTEIIQLAYDQRDQKIYGYFDQFISHLQEYLEYDKKPSTEIKKAIVRSFRLLFSFIKNKSDQIKFKDYLEVFQRYCFLMEDIVELANIYQNLGYLFWLSNDMDSSKKYLRESLELINQTENKEIPNRYTNLGFIYEYMGDYQTAEEYYLQGIKFAEQNHYQEAMFMAYDALGRLNFNQQFYQRAHNYFQAAIELHDGHSLDSSHASTVMNLASTYVFLKQYDQAVRCLKDIQKEWLEKDDPETYYSSFVNLAVYYLEMGNLAEAMKSNEKVFDYATKSNNLELIFGYYYTRGMILRKQNKLHNAEVSFKKALQLSRTAGNQRDQSRTLNHLAVIYMDSTEYEKALKFLSEAETFYRRWKNESDLTTILFNKAECYSALKNYKKAFYNQNEYIKLTQKIQKKKEKEELLLKNQQTVKASKSSHLIFNTGYTLISRELSQKIGVPIIGHSPQMQKVVQQAILVAGNNAASVLLRGESGTGKELVARLIHFSSDRLHAPFIPVNSASVTNGMAQSTLFGHEKGAFTGAVYLHKGLFEQADQGTIFLDEIADTPPDIQAYLLRILEDKKIRRLGGSSNVDSDFRLISATNSNIEEMVKKGLFRLDLLNRINTLEIVIPPLRERIDDIPLFIDFYLNEISKRLPRKPPVIEAYVIDVLLGYDYPGNVREFINIMEKLIIFCKNDYISEEDIHFLKIAESATKDEPKEYNFNLQENETRLMMLAMKKCNNVQVKAAKLLGITPYTLNRRLKKLR
jgi:DNA-binding NtrC family response regulator/uncharacterized protein HemY